MDLTQKKCIPCEGGVPPIKGEELKKYTGQVSAEWTVENNIKLKREFEFKDFNESMAFVNKIAALANQEGHHPDIHIFYSQVTLELWTHAIGGLSENDFIMAAKIDKI